jgi:hypothetical protein
MNVYVDESGDLGFTFKKPFGKGGSSRFLTIAFLLIPKTLSHLPKRIVREVYRHRKQPVHIELKGAALTIDDQIYLAKRVVNLLKKNPGIKIFAITVKKSNVEEHIRKDPNKLYNYMIGLALLKMVKKLERFTFIPDIRSIKVRSGNSLADYLQIKLWFDLRAKTLIEDKPQESHTNRNLQFIDWITHIVWESYERGYSKALNAFRGKIKLTNLFFS